MKILVGLSGGLDSTFAAHLLIREGNEVVGAAVLMHDYTDISSATISANQLGISLVVIDKRKEFDSLIKSNFAEEYALGRTPNPCIICNPLIKFGALFEYAEKNGFDYVATGHYAKVGNENGRYYITSATDKSKDQSYMLYRLSQKQLSKLILPLSDMQKKDIRDEARKLGFSSADAKESLDICFLPSGDYQSFVRERAAKTFPSGDFVDENGEKIGKHSGIINYTIGQRKGLGTAFGRPMFVSKIDAKTNEITLVPSGKEYSSFTYANDLSFMKIAENELFDGFKCNAKVRYSAKETPCTIHYDGNGVNISFETPVRAVTPGQSVVFYDKNDVLFGGIIKSAE